MAMWRQLANQEWQNPINGNRLKSIALQVSVLNHHNTFFIGQQEFHISISQSMSMNI